MSRQMRIQSIRFAESTWGQIRARSQANGISASQYIREAVIGRLAWEIASDEPEILEDWDRIMLMIRSLTLEDGEEFEAPE